MASMLRRASVLSWVVALALLPTGAGAAQPPQRAGVPVRRDDEALDAAARATAVARLARGLDSLYVVPATGAALARHVRDRLRDHAYDTITGPRAFADALSRDLAAVAHDLHLWVRYFPPMPPTGAAPDLDETWLNHGFPDVRVLDGNVGYVDVRSFTDGPDAERASAAALTLLADCDALIIDLRNNGGGSTPAMARVASALFADSVHLSDLYWRDTGDTIHVWTHPRAASAVPLSRQPVFVLTSRRTFSAAENFAYALQAVGRATVVGEPTRGGAHTGRGLQDLGAGLRALVPSGENLHPAARTNWERVGVRPDVAVPDSSALRTAHRAALEALIRRTSSGPRRERLERALTALR
jgi:hypothetical protein